MNETFMVIAGAFTTEMPELHYTPTGKAILKFKVIVNRYAGKDARGNKLEKKVSYRCSVWGKRAEYLAPLLASYINPNKEGAQPGVGCPVTVFSNQPVDFWAFVDEKATAQAKAQNPLAKPVCGAIIEVTAYQVLINAQLPKSAYDEAARRSAAYGDDNGNGNGYSGFGHTAGEEDMQQGQPETDDIPF